MTIAPIEDEVRELVALQDQAVKVATRIDEIKARLRAELPAGAHPLAGVTVTVSAPTRRWNDDVARATLSAEQIAMITEPALSGALAKRLLPPVIYEACQVASGDPRITIRA